MALAVAGFACPPLADTSIYGLKPVELRRNIKKLENKIANTLPFVEKPKVYPVAKGTVKKSGVVFVIAFMVSVFSTFLREGLEKNRTRLS